MLAGFLQLGLVGIETRTSPHPRRGANSGVQVCSLRGEMVVQWWWISPKPTMVIVVRLQVSRARVVVEGTNENQL